MAPGYSSRTFAAITPLSRKLRRCYRPKKGYYADSSESSEKANATMGFGCRSSSRFIVDHKEKRDVRKCCRTRTTVERSLAALLHFLSADLRSHCSPLPPSSLLSHTVPVSQAHQGCILPCWLCPRTLRPDLAQRIAAARRRLIASDSPLAAASILFRFQHLQATCLCTSSRATARQRARTPTCRSRRTRSSTGKRRTSCRS